MQASYEVKEQNEVIELILKELEDAKIKYPFWPDDKIHQAAIVGEEAGELLKAAIDYEYFNDNFNINTERILGQFHWVEQLKTEAIQTAAMAIRLLMNLK